jgi:hypothetical protein
MQPKKSANKNYTLINLNYINDPILNYTNFKFKIFFYHD